METLSSGSFRSISDTPSTLIPAMFFQSEPSATLDKSNKKSQPLAIDEIDCRVSPHLWRLQPQTGHTRRCVPLNRKCLLVNRKIQFRCKDSFGIRWGTKDKVGPEKYKKYNLQFWFTMVKTHIGKDFFFYTWLICLHEFPSRQLLPLADGSSSSSARWAAFPLVAFLPWTAQSSPWPVASRSKINPTHEPASTTNTQRQSPGRQARNPSLRLWRHPRRLHKFHIGLQISCRLTVQKCWCLKVFFFMKNEKLNTPKSQKHLKYTFFLFSTFIWAVKILNPPLK